MNEFLRRWNARNDESNGTLLANLGFAVVCFSVALLALIMSVRLVLTPINEDRDPAPVVHQTKIEMTYKGDGLTIDVVPSALTLKLDGPNSSDETPDGNPTDNSYDTLDEPPNGDDQYVPENPTNRSNADGEFDQYGNGTQYYNPQSPFGTRDLPYSNPDQNTPYYSNPQRQAADHAISVAVYGGCFTNSGRYQLVLDGFTPFGKYMAQTDWNGYGNFGYGDVNIADAYGRAVFNWSCFDATGIELPWGMYDVHFTDLSTGFGRTIGLRVD